MTHFDDAPAAGRVIRVKDPETLEVIGEVPISSSLDINRAIARAEAVCSRRRLPTHERSHLLHSVAEKVQGAAEEFAALIATEGIKTIREARREVSRCVVTLELSAIEAARIGGDVVSMDQVAAGAGKLGIVMRDLPGIIAAITPFNDPLNLVAHKLGPALALGAPIILKPHQQTPLCAIKLHQAFLAAGVPPDLTQIVQGGASVGAQLVEDCRPRVVSFTGGRKTGHLIASRAGLKKLIMELGGIGIVVVCGDADLDAAASAIHAAAFAAAGQNCLHAQRILVVTSVAPPLQERLMMHAANMFLGSKRDERTDMGCCIDDVAVQRIMNLLDRSIEAGGQLIAGGEHKGRGIQPTWVVAHKAGNPLAMQEVFGPISLLEPVETFEDALRRLSTSDDTLHVSVFTSSIDRAMAVFDAARAAAVLVNESTDFRIDAMPFGGIGSAGLGREGVRYAIESMAETRMLILPKSSKSMI